jgi:hypothetical protein
VVFSISGVAVLHPGINYYRYTHTFRLALPIPLYFTENGRDFTVFFFFQKCASYEFFDFDNDQSMSIPNSKELKVV